MTRPEKDEVLQTPAESNPGSSSDSPSFGAAAKKSHSAKAAEAPFAAEASADGATVITCEGSAAQEGQKASADASAVVANDELVAQAQAEREEWKDKFMRLHAEWDTYRRRTAEQRSNEKAQATEKLVEHLLPVIDDFERTIDYADKNGEAGLLGGVQAVHTKLIDALKKEGVVVLDPKGEAFDALEAQAINTTEDKTVPDETVAEVFQKGYKMGKKVLRPAMVTVATGGPKREVSPETEEE